MILCTSEPGSQLESTRRVKGEYCVSAWLCWWVLTLCAWSWSWSWLLEDVKVSNRTPANANADRPPLQMVPGHNEGENRNAQLAVNRQPSPRPAFAELRNAAGCARTFAAVALAIDSVLRPIDEGTRDGDLPNRMDAPIVIIESKPPAINVKFTSPFEHVRDEAFQAKDRDAPVDPTLAEETDVFAVGSGGLRYATVMTSARYPSSKSEKDVWIVNPAKSETALSRIAASVSFLVIACCIH